MRVLLVEDEPKLLKTLSKALKEEGYAVDTAKDGDDGLYKAQFTNYDVIILDIMLPGIDGWEVLNKLRKTKKTPVIFLSAKDTTQDRVRGLDNGADDYLIKPFNLTELFSRVRSVIRRAANEPVPKLTIGPIVLDTLSRTVNVKGKRIPLTGKEYMILEYLAHHHNKVVTRTELYEHVFDDQEDTTSNLLDVHIYNIRKKLDVDFITTRRGHGYSIEG
ncbi:MAG: response regulator transcription factor [Verrucomicrobiota bacterium]|jgi:two-component system OmpR family response regulator|nr:response regulator transcription factor [Verrucomicrobiota bacterium]